MQVERLTNDYIKCNGQMMKISRCRQCIYYCDEGDEWVECADEILDYNFKIEKINRIKNTLEEFYGKRKNMGNA